MSNEVQVKEKKPGFFSKVGKFFKDLKSEAKKVVWPTWKQTVNNTWAVIVAIVIVGIFIGALDLVFNFLRDTLIKVL